jgi:serine phosphatase RsbU (regulator of sigma subunit)
LIIGAVLEPPFSAAQVNVPARARLYVFSDGIFEIEPTERPWGLDDFVQLVQGPIVAGASECERLYGAAKAACRLDHFAKQFPTFQFRRIDAPRSFRASSNGAAILEKVRK